MAETVELTLPPHSYVTVMAHDEPNEHSHTFHVTNNGEVPVIAESIHHEADDEEHPLVETIAPSQSHQFKHGENYKKCVLKVTNNTDQEAVFSATGGKATAADLQAKIKPMVKEHTEAV
ncbi:unnamed protein product [Psylliodes chrysocephalus]|uniref:Uncharacterized protein n=1 Tax=Psylliodes chrysocephalus TaxID=3402493 RepID=A0A9P0D7J1_9CUCU|nr:unnamed protein product [Psylliodes chrysocephala]